MCYDKCNKNVKLDQARDLKVLRELRASRYSPLQKPGSKKSPESRSPSARKLETKVKTVAQLSNGKIENLLVPFLVSSSMVCKKSHTRDEFIEEKIDDIPVVFQEQLEEYGGSEDEEVGPFAVPHHVHGAKDTAKKPDPPIAKDGGQSAFLDILLHTLGCRKCENISCNKMRLVLGHFLNCQKVRNLDSARAKNCAICNQLIQVILLHALDCAMPGNCPVPMCDSLKKKNVVKLAQGLKI